LKCPNNVDEKFSCILYIKLLTALDLADLTHKDRKYFSLKHVKKKEIIKIILAKNMKKIT
jgi:hypothetical protein